MNMDEDSIRRVLGAIAGGTLGAKGGKTNGVSGGIVGAICGLFAADLVNAATRMTSHSDLAKDHENASVQEVAEFSVQELTELCAIGMACGWALSNVLLEVIGVDLEAGLPKFNDSAEEVRYFTARLPQAQESFEGSFRWMLEKVASTLRAEGISIDVDETLRKLGPLPIGRK